MLVVVLRFFKKEQDESCLSRYRNLIGRLTFNLAGVCSRGNFLWLDYQIELARGLKLR